MLNRLLTVLSLVLWALPAVAQDFDTAWVRTYNGTGDNSDYAYAIAVDAIGNVCVTGQSWGGGTGYDYATVKYYPDGDTAWVRRYSDVVGNGSDVGMAVAVDGDNNVCVTGSSWNGANTDYVTIKYDPDGTQLWQETLNRWQENARDIAADSSGNVYVTGFSSPTPTAPFDFVTIKYEPDGETAWVRVFNGPANGDDSASAIVVDNSGNVYVTGQCKLMSSPYTLRGFGTIKYDPAGNFVWARFLSPPPNCNDYPLDMAVDDSDNVYVTGRGNGVGFDYLTVKYASDGTQLWVKTYNGPGNGSDFATGIAVDGYGNVYVTGQSVATSLDYATIKYDPDGNQLWVRRYDGGYTDDFPTSIAVDDPGNVYVTGGSIGDGTGFDYTTIKYDPDSTQLWVQRYNGAGNRDDNGNAIAVDGFGHVYVTGSCDLGFNAGDYATIKYWQNYPPNSFSLLSPGNNAFVPSPVNFDWEDATDPDSWDEVRYDLYVSTSQAFHPDSTVVYDSLLASEHSDDFELGTHYWKVRAYDNHAEVWSNQTWSLVVEMTLFGPATNYEVGSHPFSVFCVDLDGDLDLDLAVANWGSNDVSILKNNGNGTFAGAVDYEAGEEPRYVFCADLDGDSDLDLAVANASGDDVCILKNNGNGTLQTAVNYAAGDLPYSVFCADLDGDDDLDMVVANHNSDNVSILKNNGDGVFQSAVNYLAGNGPWSAFCADLDRDGDLDLAVANALGNNVSILVNNGDGSFADTVNYTIGRSPRRVFCAHLDGDLYLDLTVTNAHDDSVSILMSNGDGTFATAVNYAVGDEPVTPFCADLDGDLDLDLAVSNGYDDDVSILMNNGDGTFQSGIDYETGDGPTTVFCADLDGDGDLDLALSNENSNSVSILMNLTQAPANQPPNPFSLLFPADGDSVLAPLTLDWETPYDPNFGDQIRYDLYVSTVPNFDPDSTVVYDSLPVSRLTDTLGMGIYYWKAKAHDNWGAVTWSTESWSFQAFSRGDTNGDGIVNIGDVVYLVSYLYKNGPAPAPVESGDVNCDEIVNVGDVVYLVSYLYKNGPPPSC